MSRTNKGAKSAGYDYWSRRPYSTSYGYGPDIKKLCHRAERRQNKKIAKDNRDGFLQDKRDSE